MKKVQRRWWLPLTLLLLLPMFLSFDHRFKRPPRKNFKTELFQGISYSREVRRSPRPLIIHTVSIDLSLPVIEFLVTPGDDTIDMDVKARTTSNFLEEYGVQLAINGNFFTPFKASSPWNYYPRRGDGVNIQGLAISDGWQYSDDDPAFPVLCLASSYAEIRYNGCPPGTVNALAGNHILVEQGARAAREDNLLLHPRTAVATGQGGKLLWFIIVDGRQKGYSEGVSLVELADIILELGAEAALNLDGGGSSTLVVAEGKRARLLNAPYHTSIYMRQRPVANHLGVYALPVK
jgi:hypothetical protein